MKIRAVLFDLDGTLTKFNLDYRSARVKITEELNKLNLGEFKPEEGLTLNAMLNRVQGKIPDEEFTRLLGRIHSIMEEYELESAERTELLPHARETLQTLKDNGLKTAVVTNNGRAAANVAINRFNLSPLIDILVTREDASRWKPEGATVKEALKKLKVRPKEAVFVGDSTIDVLAAQDSKVVSVAIPTGPTKTRDLLSTAPDYVIPSLAEFPSLLDRLRTDVSKKR
ncbi:MAG: HAD family hydrolase [Nitrososphaerales archaeon]